MKNHLHFTYNVLQKKQSYVRRIYFKLTFFSTIIGDLQFLSTNNFDPVLLVVVAVVVVVLLPRDTMWALIFWLSSMQHLMSVSHNRRKSFCDKS